MKKFNHWLNGLTIKLTIALVIMTGLVSILRGCRVERHKTELSKLIADAEKDGVTVETLLARIDGVDTTIQGEIKPYTTAFSQLQQNCQDSRADLATMTAEIVRHEKKHDARITYLEAMEYFSAMVEDVSQNRSIKCAEVFSDYVEDSQGEQRSKLKKRSR